MRFFASASALLAMTVAAVAQTADFNPVYTPSENEEVPAGSTFEITWSAPAKYADGTVSISLIGGADQGTQVPIADIATGVPNSDEKYSWTVDASLGADAVYGLVFKFESNPEIFQYSQPFHIKAGESTGGETTVVTTHAGVKTVTLTSCPPESTTTAPGTTVTPDTTVTVPVETPTETPSTTLITSTKFENTTSVVIPTPPTTIVQPPVPTTEVPPPPPATTTPPAQVPPESGAARVGSALFAVVGGVAAVLLL
jgi:hypothetical protein